MDRVVEQLGILSETAVRFSRCASAREIHARALDAVTGLTGASRASILLFDPDGVLRFQAWRGLSDRYRSAVEGHTPWTPGQREPEPIQVPDTSVDEGLGRIRSDVIEEGIRALAFFPLAAAGGTIGEIMVCWDTPHACGPAELGLLRTVAGLTAFAIDRQRAMEELEVERGLFVGGPSVVFKWQNRPHWPVEYVSPNVETVFGYPPAALREGTRYSSLIHPEDLQRVGAEVEAYVGDGRPWFEQEYRLRRADGRWRWIYDFTVPIRAVGGEVTHFHGYVLDQTERRAAFDELLQQQRIEGLGLMAGGVAHDFNNLLVGVLGNAELALASLPAEGPAAGYVRDVAAAARHASELTKQLLAYSGKVSFSIQSIELLSLVEECIRLLVSVLSPRARVSVDVPAGLAVRGDATLLRQIVINLLTNASDALGEGGGAIRVDARPASVAVGATLTLPGQSLGPGSYVVLRVVDQGVGMEEPTLARVFEPFYSTKGQGRGLGLSAILGIVRSHKGAVHVESAPGAGSTFVIYLPAALPAGEGAGPPSGVPPQPPVAQPALPPVAPREASRAVLVVDDDEMVRTVVARVLELEGRVVVTVDCAERALELLAERAGAWDAVIMDLTMPRMGGLTALARMRERWPSLPVVLMSGFSRTSLSSQDDPATRFLEKPFTTQELLAMLASTIAGAR